MAVGKQNSSPRYVLACWTMGCSGAAIVVLAFVSIWFKRDNAMTVFNIALPVFASWVGTILAFYFGRENFESANQQVRDLVAQINPEQRSKAPVTTIMRPFSDTSHFKIEDGKTEADIKLSELMSFFKDKVTRLPILDAKGKVKYMLHASGIDKYRVAGHPLEDTLKTFIETQEKAGFQYDLNKGFVVVSKQTSLNVAKRKMEAAAPCQDIFVTGEGGADESPVGWISNLRMAKYLEA